jgi:thymidylate synthase
MNHPREHYRPRVVEAENVNEAFYTGLTLIRDHGVFMETRNGPSKKLAGLLVTHYKNPKQRCLFVPERDANPFFHHLESLWMLSGSNTIEFPAHYVPSMKGFSDDGVTFNAAYGWRWREEFGVDQVEEVISALAKDPNSRRVVLQMWNTQNDLMRPTSRDLACNLLAKFYIMDNLLMMDVCCRSNDMVLGGYGANAVHFSFLQEYICDRLRLEGLPLRVGVYNQISMDAHLYTGQLYGDKLWTNVNNALDADPSEQATYVNAYSTRGYKGDRLVTVSPLLFRVTDETGMERSSIIPNLEPDPVQFDQELQAIIKHRSNARHELGGFESPYFEFVIDPMLNAYDLFREDDLAGALGLMTDMRDNFRTEFSLWKDQRLDVEVACTEWLERRVARRLQQTAA